MEEIKSLKNIKTSFQLMKWIVLGIVAACLVISVISIKMSFDYAENQRNNIYVLDNNKSLILALSQDINLHQEALIEASIKQFHEQFFTFGASKESIKYHTDEAMKLADRSAYNIYNTLVESQFYNNLIAAKASQEFRLDSIRIDVNSSPLSAITYGRVYIVRTSNLTERALITKCNIRRIVRDSYNPYGYMLEKIEILKNEDIREVAR